MGKDTHYKKIFMQQYKNVLVFEFENKRDALDFAINQTMEIQNSSDKLLIRGSYSSGLAWSVKNAINNQ